MGNCDPYSDSPEPAVVEQPQSTRVEEPTLLCNQVDSRIGAGRSGGGVGGVGIAGSALVRLPRLPSK